MEEGDLELYVKRVRRKQDVRTMYQARLVEVKEHEKEGERRESAMKNTVDEKMKEKLAEVAQGFACACCFETLGERSLAFKPCGHAFCNGACCLSAQAVECPECRQAVVGRVVPFGALANAEAALAVGGLRCVPL